MIFAGFFILGLIIGSFLNVVVYRLHVAESLYFGRSHCPNCRKPIRWYDNIPVISFILLKFRCRDCQEKISWQYPLVEIATSVLFLAIGLKFFEIGNTASIINTLYLLVMVSFLMVILVYDILYMEVPGMVLWPAVAWTIGLNLFFDWNKAVGFGSISNSLIYSGVLAGFAAFLIFFFMVIVSREKWMGMGDAYLVILLGLFLGWPNVLLALFLAFAIGAISGIALIIAKKKTMKSQVPFAPFLIIGTILTLFYCEPIINWYLRLFQF